ncbi:MAG: PIN domain protein [Leptospiraceae bacterium]|nr:PIN domain protein [Leptospiraceae bacterium]
MKKLRLYLDTSVIGGCFDPEFAEESNLLIQQIKLGKYYAVISDTTFKELEGAPQQIRDLVRNLPTEHLIEIAVTQDIIDLAAKYVSEKVVPAWCQADALHIATATFHNADLLLSWNFKQSVNVNRIMGYNSINLREGYKSLEIRSPKEVVYDS